MPNDPWYYLVVDPDVGGHLDISRHLSAISVSDHYSFPELSNEMSAGFTTLVQMLLEWVRSTNTAGAASGRLGGGEVTFDFVGENSSVLLVDGSRPIAVKVYPSHKRAAARLEAWYLSTLGDYKYDMQQEDPSPVNIPDYIRYEPAAPTMLEQLWQTRLRGEKLSNDRIRQLSDAEKRAAGTKLGASVAWMARAISPEKYKALLEESGNPVLFDRAELIRNVTNMQNLPRRFLTMDDREFAQRAATKGSELYQPLVALLRWMEGEYKALEVGGLLHSSNPIVGHDDLRPDNMLFTTDDGEWSLDGLLDFGLTRCMDPERIFRHIVPLGEAFYGPAIEAYERETGRRIDRRKLHLWAIGQAATMATAYAMSIDKVVGLRGATANRQRLRAVAADLQALVPEHDWSGLAA